MGIVTKADKEIAILRRSRVLSCILLPFGLRPVAPPLKDGRPGGDGARAVPEQPDQLGGHLQGRELTTVKVTARM